MTTSSEWIFVITFFAVLLGAWFYQMKKKK